MERTCGRKRKRLAEWRRHTVRASQEASSIGSFPEHHPERRTGDDGCHVVVPGRKQDGGNLRRVACLCPEERQHGLPKTPNRWFDSAASSSTLSGMSIQAAMPMAKLRDGRRWRVGSRESTRSHLGERILSGCPGFRIKIPLRPPLPFPQNLATVSTEYLRRHWPLRSRGIHGQ
jgi:hypothetical protein